MTFKIRAHQFTWITNGILYNVYSFPFIMIRASYSTDRRRDRLSTVGKIVSGLGKAKHLSLSRSEMCRSKLKPTTCYNNSSTNEG
jgi:hypothetical protein